MKYISGKNSLLHRIMISEVIECEKIVELLPMRAKIANEPITVILH